MLEGEATTSEQALADAAAAELADWENKYTAGVASRAENNQAGEVRQSSKLFGLILAHCQVRLYTATHAPPVLCYTQSIHGD